MYDFYPEWGPSRHRQDDDQADDPVRRPRYWREPAMAMAGAPEARDSAEERPDDN